MSCCGQTTTTPLTDRHRMKIRYLGGRPINVQGPVTGVIYRFSGLDRERLVDPRDAIGLVRSQMFRILGVEEIQTTPANGLDG